MVRRQRSNRKHIWEDVTPHRGHGGLNTLRQNLLAYAYGVGLLGALIKVGAMRLFFVVLSPSSFFSRLELICVASLSLSSLSVDCVFADADVADTAAFSPSFFNASSPLLLNDFDALCPCVVVGVDPDVRGVSGGVAIVKE